MHEALPSDTETTRTTVDQLPDDVAYALLDAMRERRLRAAALFAEAQEMKAKARSERVREMLDKQIEMYHKDIAQCDKVLAKLDARANKIRALRLELDALT
jgi:hypothetical protein